MCACAGDESSLYVYTSCGQRLLQVGNDAVIGQGATCVSFGSSGLSIELGMGLINVMVRRLPPHAHLAWSWSVAGMCLG